MFLKLLEFGMGFDWITPALAQLQDLACGYRRRIMIIGGGSGWSGRRIGKMLNEHGIHYWGMMIVNGKLLVTVRQEQAQIAQYLVQREGILLLNPLPSDGVQESHGEGCARPGHAQREPEADLFGLFFGGDQ